YPNGRVFRVIDPVGGQQTYFYSLFHRQSVFVNERGDATTYTYDTSGHMVRMENPDHTSETFTYTNGLLTAKTDVFGTTETYKYDAHGNIIDHVDKAGVETIFTYDPIFNKVTNQVRVNDHQVTQYQYDAHGNLVQETDPLGGVTTMTYDAHGLMTSRTLP